MGTSALKSAAITNLDATPVVASTTGEGAQAYLHFNDGFVTAVAADAAGSTYRLLRVRSNVKMKSLILESEAQGAGKINLSLYYSDSTVDGTTVANQGLIVPTTGDQLFASDVDLASAVAPTSVLNESGNFTIAKRLQPLWQAAGLATDPGGFFDIVGVVHTTAITTGTGKIYVRSEYVE